MSDVICAKCQVPIQGPAEPKPEDVFSCPICGTGDTHENVMREVSEYVRDQAAEHLARPLRDLSRTSKHVKFTEGPREQRTYRFIVTTGLE